MAIIIMYVLYGNISIKSEYVKAEYHYEITEWEESIRD